MKRYKLILRIAKRSVIELSVVTNDLMNIKRIIQKYNVKLIGVKPLWQQKR